MTQHFDYRLSASDSISEHEQHLQTFVNIREKLYATSEIETALLQ